MHYYIDGYNLLFRIIRDDDRFKEQRELIIRELSDKFQLLQIDATIVFDAQYQIGDSVRSHFKHLEVVFTNQGETADDYIIAELKNAPRMSQEVVVTSDKKLAWYARRCSAKTESVETFTALLEKRFKNKVKQQRLQPQPKKTVAPKAKPPAAITPLTQPEASLAAEECDDYYLKIFEARYENLKDQPGKEIKKSAKSSKLRVKPKIQKSEEPAVSEMERWLRLFEGS